MSQTKHTVAEMIVAVKDGGEGKNGLMPTWAAAIAVLRASGGLPVRITFRDGEEVAAQRVRVHDDLGVITYDLIRSNRPGKYERFDLQPGYVAELVDVAEAAMQAEN